MVYFFFVWFEMITTERMIGAQIRIFASNGEELKEAIDRIQKGIYGLLLDLELRNSERGTFQVHLVEPRKCANCRKLFTDCKCGEPFKRPAV
jgi:predicted metal-binding protein